MTVKDIIFLKSVTPITPIDKPSRETIEMAARFLNDFRASSFFEKTRMQFQLPEKGYDIRPYIGQNLLDPTVGETNPIYAVLQLVSSSLKGALDFDDSMVDQILLLVFFNACIDLRYFNGFLSKPIQFINGRKNIASTIVDYPQEVGAILVPYLVSQKSLIRWIKQNWKAIDKQINENLTTNPFVIKVHKNTELVTEIIDLKDKQNKSFSAIASLLIDKYPQDPRVASEEWVKRVYYYSKKSIPTTTSPMR